MVSGEQIQKLIQSALPGCEVRAIDMTGGGDHWQVKVIAPQFKTLGMIEQHQAVYKALGSLMDKEIHALSLDTQAP